MTEIYFSQCWRLEFSQHDRVLEKVLFLVSDFPLLAKSAGAVDLSGTAFIMHSPIQEASSLVA